MPGKSEGEVLRDVRVALTKAGIPNWRNHVGVSRQESGQMARSGLALGSADIIACVPGVGRMLALEVKREIGGRVSKHQRAWLEVVRRAGGVAGVVRSVEEAMRLVDEARALPRLEEQ